MKYKLLEFFSFLISTLIATLRFHLLCIILYFSGLQQIFFTRAEISNLEMKVIPLRCDKEKMSDKLAYIDKLCIENPELVETVEDEIYENDDEDDLEDDE